MILGIGTDLCDIARIQRALDRFGTRFAEKILVESELKRFHSHRKPAAFLAKRFAAKEAMSKAMGTGIRHPVNWHNMAVANDRRGKPSMQFSEPLQKLLETRGVGAVHLSITDETTLAAAYVIIEGQS